MTNYVKPHEATQPSLVSSNDDSDDSYKTSRVTAYLSVYRVHRCYGGAEEGGWWYDAYEFMGASFPFRAEQDFDAVVFEEASDTGTSVTRVDDDGTVWYWQADGHPRVTDEPTRVRLQSVWLHLTEIYGAPGTTHRNSCAQRGDDYAFVYELQPGALATRARPRYS